MMKTQSQQKSQDSTVRKVLRYVGKYKLLIALSILLAVVTVAGTLYVPILVGNAIDMAVGVDSVDLIGIVDILIRIAVIAAITALLQWIMNSINNHITYSVVRDVRSEAFR